MPTDIRQTAFLVREADIPGGIRENDLRLYSHEECLADKKKQAMNIRHVEEELSQLCPSCRAQAEEARCPVCGRPAASCEGAVNPAFDQARYERLRRGGET